MITIPTVLIIPPAILAMVVYMGLYYKRDPDNRVTDARFLLAMVCVAVIFGQMFVVIQGYDQRYSSLVFFTAVLGLLIGAVWMIFGRGPKALGSGR
jgi:hypothetical protein